MNSPNKNTHTSCTVLKDNTFQLTCCSTCRYEEYACMSIGLACSCCCSCNLRWDNAPISISSCSNQRCTLKVTWYKKSTWSIKPVTTPKSHLVIVKQQSDIQLCALSPLDVTIKSWRTCSKSSSEELYHVAVSSSTFDWRWYTRNYITCIPSLCFSPTRHGNLTRIKFDTSKRGTLVNALSTLFNR